MTHKDVNRGKTIFLGYEKEYGKITPKFMVTTGEVIDANELVANGIEIPETPKYELWLTEVNKHHVQYKKGSKFASRKID